MSLVWKDEKGRKRRENLNSGTYRIGRKYSEKGNYVENFLYLRHPDGDDQYMKKIEIVPPLVSRFEGDKQGSVRIDFEKGSLKVYRCKNSSANVKAYLFDYRKLDERALTDENLFIMGRPVELTVEDEGEGLKLSPGQGAALYVYHPLSVVDKDEEALKLYAILTFFIGSIINS